MSNIDLPHVWSLGFIWQIPAFRSQRGALGKILGGWEISGVQRWSSGRPLQPVQNNSGPSTVTDRSFNHTFFGQFDSLRPFAGNPRAPLTSVGFVQPGGRLVDYNNRNNPVTLDQVRWVYNNLDAARLFGWPFGIGRNVLRGPSFSRANFAVFKNFRFRERCNLQYRFESTNIFNHPSFGNPNPMVDVGTATTFLNPTETEVAPRGIVTGLRLQF